LLSTETQATPWKSTPEETVKEIPTPEKPTDLSINDYIYTTSRNISMSDRKESKPTKKLRLKDMKTPPVPSIPIERRDEFNKKQKIKMHEACEYLAKAENRSVDDFKKDLHINVIKPNDLTNHLSFVSYLLQKIKLIKDIKKPIGVLTKMLSEIDKHFAAFDAYCVDYERQEQKAIRARADIELRHLETKINKRLDEIRDENAEILDEYMQEFGFSYFDEKTNDYRLVLADAIYEKLHFQRNYDKVIQELLARWRELAVICGRSGDGCCKLINRSIDEEKLLKEQISKLRQKTVKIEYRKNPKLTAEDLPRIVEACQIKAFAKPKTEDFINGFAVITQELEKPCKKINGDRNAEAFKKIETLKAQGLIPESAGVQRKIVVNGQDFAGLLD